MKKLTCMLTLLILLVLSLHSVLGEQPAATLPQFPTEHAAAFELASAALQAHTPGAVVDYAVRGHDDGHVEWKLFFVLNGQLGETEVVEEKYTVRQVRLYDMPEGALTSWQAMTALQKEKGDVRITDLEMDLDDGRLRYEGEAVLGEARYEFEMSVTGEILEWEPTDAFPPHGRRSVPQGAGPFLCACQAENG